MKMHMNIILILNGIDYYFAPEHAYANINVHDWKSHYHV